MTSSASMPSQNKPFGGFLGTQFLGALNDNAFKMFLLGIAASLVAEPLVFKTAVTIAFTVPFLIFSPLAGFLADRFSKRSVLVVFKFVEAAVMGFGFFAFWFQSPVLIVVSVFLMGTQSAFFSPSKYGILPELTDTPDLSARNGLVQLTTFVGIVLGQTLGGLLRPHFAEQAHLASLIFIGIAITGTITAFRIPKTAAGDPHRQLELGFFSVLWHSILEIRRIRGLGLTVLGIAYFWFLGALIQLLVTDYGEHLEKLSSFVWPEQIYTFLLVALSLGIGGGAFMAGRFSRHTIEFGLVPIGSLVMGIGGLLFAASRNTAWAAVLSLFFLGYGSGFFIIPLTTYLQAAPPAAIRGRLIAASNFLSFVGVTLAGGVYYGTREFLQMSAGAVCFWIALLTFGVTGTITWLLPGAMTRSVIWVLTRTVYRLTVHGAERIPQSGPVLLVCNHISYADAALLSAATNRFIRFLMFKEFLKFPVLGWLARRLRVIPIDGSDSPKNILRSLRQARESLLAGEAVCIFPEGQVSRTGNLLRFRPGLEFILRGMDVPVLPVFLDRVWGSIFSYERRCFFFKYPLRLPYPVSVCFGEPLRTPVTTQAIRERIQELGGEAFRARSRDWLPLHLSFFKLARRRFWKPMMSDSLGRRFTYGRALTAVWLMAGKMRQWPAGDRYVGVILPSSTAGVLVNIALLAAGKIPVNLNFTSSGELLSHAIRISSIRRVVTSRALLEKVTLPSLDAEMFHLEDWQNAFPAPVKLFHLVLLALFPTTWLSRVFRPGKEPAVTDTATIMFSSGSTGIPKGVVLSHANIHANVESLSQVLHTDSEAVLLGSLPFFHSFGFTGTLWFPLLRGIKVVYHTNPRDAKTIGELVEINRATILVATPTFLLGYIARCTPAQFKTLKLVITGAEKLRERVRNSFKEKFGLEPREGYGCTECAPIVSVNVPDIDCRGIAGERILQAGTKHGTIGHPIPGVAVRVIDPLTRESLPWGERGILVVKGANVMHGYLGDVERTHEVLVEGWYHTGDVARLDEDGFIEILDRVARFSKIGGEMVPHMKIEESIHELFADHDTQCCAVTAIPDDKKGERLIVIHIPLPQTPDWIVRRLMELGLPNLWIPRPDSFLEVEDIPLLGTGKMDLGKIKELALRERGNWQVHPSQN